MSTDTAIGCDRCREALTRLREALAFYAHDGNYVPAGIAPTIWQDNGKRAREALRGADVASGLSLGTASGQGWTLARAERKCHGCGVTIDAGREYWLWFGRVFDAPAWMGVCRACSEEADDECRVHRAAGVRGAPVVCRLGTAGCLESHAEGERNGDS